MAETLYRRYRPTTFADLVDQRHVRITLEHALTQDRVAHAYLFTGPRGVGKTTIARVFARAVNCQQRPSTSAEPCNTCPTCVAQLSGSSLDVIEIDAASQTGVENVRENIIQSARAIPSQGKYKVFIIDEVHMLSTSAFNALLKLLEEPPTHALFILATTELHRIPATVISRTQRFDFKKIRLPDIVTRLERLAASEKRSLGAGVVDRIARAADGSLRDAEGMLSQLFSFPEKSITEEIADIVLPRTDRARLLIMTEAIVRQQTPTALAALHQFVDDGGDVQMFVHELVSLSRALLLASIDRRLMEEAMTTEDESTMAALAELAVLRPSSFYVSVAETLLEAERQTHHAPIPEFPLEVAIISLGGANTSPSIVASNPMSDKPANPPTPPEPNEEPPVTKKKAKRATTTGQLFDEAAVNAAWQSVQQQAAADHPGLALSIKLAQVHEVHGDEVVIAAPFALHAERLNAPTQRAHLGELFSSALGQPVRLSVIQAETIPEPAPSRVDEPSVTAAAANAGLAPSGPKNELWDQVVATFS